MAQKPHDLNEEFPAMTEQLHEMKMTDAHFARIVDEYNALNERIHLSESNVRPVSADYESDLRRRRMVLKDRIARILAGALPQN